MIICSKDTYTVNCHLGGPDGTKIPTSQPMALTVTPARLVVAMTAGVRPVESAARQVAALPECTARVTNAH